MKYLALIAAVVALMLALALPWTARAADLSPPAARAAMANGNYKDAYDALAPKVTAAAGTDQLAADFQVCVNALNNLGRVDEVDGFMEKAVAAHPADWRLLQTAARNYRDQQHFGTIISGVVRNLTNYGAFIEIEEGIDGLLHVSDMSWVRKVAHPSEVVSKGVVSPKISWSITRRVRSMPLTMLPH